MEGILKCETNTALCTDCKELNLDESELVIGRYGIKMCKHISWDAASITQQNLEQISDQDALKVAELLGGASHFTKESQIAQVKELLVKRYNGVTNISGYSWYKAWKYLESQNYQID